MITLVIPFIDTFEDFVAPCVRHAVKNSRQQFELLMIDNGSDKSYETEIKKLLRPNVLLRYVRNRENLGVINSFRQGLDNSIGDIICFIHSDVLIHEPNWEKKIEYYFDNDPNLGLAGFLGGDAVYPDGGREHVVSNMRGETWGKCGCHEIAAYHHGNFLEGISPAIVLDGVGLFFKWQCLQQISSQTDALDPNIKPPHHFYDRNLVLWAAKLGWHTAAIGIGFDHWSGATANTSDKYAKLAESWLDEHVTDWKAKNEGMPIDQAVYNEAYRQFRQDWEVKLPAKIDGDYTVRWQL